MEGFKYVDIFATKGIEYIVVIGFLIMLVWFWRWLNKPSISPVVIDEVVKNRVSLVDWFRLSNDFYYHQGHSWVNPERGGIVSIGIDDFAQKMIGKPAKLYLPEKDKELRQGENAIQVEIDGKIIDFLSPVDGKVVAINQKAIQFPEIINQDPYQEGWLIKVKSNRLGSNLKNLLHGKVAQAWIEETVNKLSRIITGNQGIVLQDGGKIINGFARELSPEAWEHLAAEFFLTKE